MANWLILDVALFILLVNPVPRLLAPEVKLLEALDVEVEIIDFDWSPDAYKKAYEPVMLCPVLL